MYFESQLQSVTKPTTHRYARIRDRNRFYKPSNYRIGHQKLSRSTNLSRRSSRKGRGNRIPKAPQTTTCRVPPRRTRIHGNFSSCRPYNKWWKWAQTKRKGRPSKPRYLHSSLNAANIFAMEKENERGNQIKNDETKTRTRQPECAGEKQKKQLRPNAMQRHVCSVFRDKQWTGPSTYLCCAG